MHPKETSDTSQKRGSPGYDTKLHLIVKLSLLSVYLFIARTSRSTLRGSGCTYLDLFMGGLDLFKIVLIQYQILMLHSCKLFILRIVTLSYKCLLRIIRLRSPRSVKTDVFDCNTAVRIIISC